MEIPFSVCRNMSDLVIILWTLTTECHLQLLDSCLKSPLLPAYLAAAFCKKLSRLSLAVPPSGALVIIALIHNLLRRHPSINCLVHQVRLWSLALLFCLSLFEMSYLMWDSEGIK